jgi:CelD/BcsL family acetyltransferase involved in cellulose biosynthesis
LKSVTFRLADGFDDPSISNEAWNNLLKKGHSDIVFMTKEWQQTWWKVYGRGSLLLILAESDGELITIAPLFADQGMIFFIGSGGSDYLDFIGEIRNKEILEGILECAMDHTDDFCGFRFYHVLEDSVTQDILKELEQKRIWKLYEEGSLGAPLLEIGLFPELAQSAVRKKSLLRHEAYFQKNGGIEVVDFKNKAFVGEMEAFFAQHVSRWAETQYPSLFVHEKNREFYTRLSRMSDQIDWLRLTGIRWQGQMIAYHFGFVYKNIFIWYKPTFNIELSKYSPGEVLLRQLILLSVKNEYTCFDFGLGEEPFKSRFANRTRMVNTWGLYPSLISS